MAESLSFTFSMLTCASHFGPRLGSIFLARRAGSNMKITINTPGLITGTSRGVVPHLSRDHLKLTQAIQLVHIPFETFLEQSPPVVTLQTGIKLLHTFLGYQPLQHVLSLSIRAPDDGREMPSNGNHHITAHCVRGVRKVTPAEWRAYILKCQPDLVVALSDTPFTQPPYSQKRLTKSIERSTAWLAHLLQPVEPSHTQSPLVSSNAVHANDEDSHPLNVLVHMAGGTSTPARAAFVQSLTETLHGKEADTVKPLKCLDDGVKGYVFDLVPLRLSLVADARGIALTSLSIPDVTSPGEVNSTPNLKVDTSLESRIPTDDIVPLMKTSLEPLPTKKLRLVNSARSPHEMLRLIFRVGVDLFDAAWAQKAADVGVALDFRFPAPNTGEKRQNATEGNDKDTDGGGERPKCNLGHNLYDPVYAHDFSRLAGCFLDGASASTNADATALVCPCAACSPLAPATRISHSTVDEPSLVNAKETVLPPYTRAYLHHLLHTHEMSSHSLLVMHNLAVVDAFFAGVRSVLIRDTQVDSAEKPSQSHFSREVERFVEEYDEELAVFDEAKVMWNEVDFARGKGRLAREREKRSDGNGC